jgi:hypothetical protein
MAVAAPPRTDTGALAPAASRRATPTGRAPLVSTRPRRDDASHALPGPHPAGSTTERRAPSPPDQSRRRRDVLVLVLLAALFIALFWAAATAPTGAAPPPRSHVPPSASS